MNNLLLDISTENLITPSMYYILSAVLILVVLLGIYLMSRVQTAVLGNALGAIAMGLGIVLTLVHYNILPSWILYPGLAVGSLIGLVMAAKVKMIQMPQMVALLNGLGGAASAIVGMFSFLAIGAEEVPNTFSQITSLFAITVGLITLFGSLVAAGKLHRVLSQKPVILPLHAVLTSGSLLITIAVSVFGAFSGVNLYLALAVAFVFSTVFGIIFTIRVGGADMPITISLLNSLSGVAGAIAGLAINDLLLVAIGGIVGASGLLLTQIMCKAMNRHLMDILLGKTTSSSKSSPVQPVSQPKEIIRHEFNPIEVLKNAKKVIIVPGYGMAIAQAQHLVKELADRLVKNGAKIKYAIHPVAGRMPGHMNVLLCEANVDYDDLYEMDQINEEFKDADVTLVIGANDVLNPAAREAKGTPIYGMPILNVDQCKNIIIFNYDLKPGYAGVNNPIYSRTEGICLMLGNASETLRKVLDKLK